MKQAVKDFFHYVERKTLPFEEDSKIIERIKTKLQEGNDLQERNKWGAAFESLSKELVEHFVILDREGIAIAKEVIKQCKLDKNWEFRLKRINSTGYIKGSWKLVDSEQLANEFKYTFYKPSRKITENIAIGNIVKATFAFKSRNKEHPEAERMWIQINEITNNGSIGKLDNHPFYIHDLYVGDQIAVEHKHIMI